MGGICLVVPCCAVRGKVHIHDTIIVAGTKRRAYKQSESKTLRGFCCFTRLQHVYIWSLGELILNTIATHARLTIRHHTSLCASSEFVDDLFELNYMCANTKQSQSTHNASTNISTKEVCDSQIKE